MLVVISVKYGNNSSRIVGATEWTWNAGRKEGRMDRWSETNIHPQPLCSGRDSTEYMENNLEKQNFDEHIWR